MPTGHHLARVSIFPPSSGSAGAPVPAIQRAGGAGDFQPVPLDLSARILAAARGRVLEPRVQGHLEQRLGGDLGGVHVHTDDEAHRLAQSLDAVAFTSGRDIFFRRGAYTSGSADGLQLLAHEAMHVIQQSAGPVAGTPTRGNVAISDPTDPFERAATTASRLLSAVPDAQPKARAATPVARHGVGASRLALQRNGLPPKFTASPGVTGIAAAPLDMTRASVDPKLVPALMRVQTVLADNALVFKYLVLLDKEMREDKQAGRAKDSDTALEHVLRAEELAHGFSQAPILLGAILPGSLFVEMLKVAGQAQFHDLGVAYEHGIETHRIQWYVIMKDIGENRAAYPGVANAQELYMVISSGKLNKSGNLLPEMSLWRALFDRDMTLLTGSSPETFINYIRQNAAANFPQLGEIFDVNVQGGKLITQERGKLEFHNLWLQRYAKLGLLEQLKVFPENKDFRKVAENLAKVQPKEANEITAALNFGLELKIKSVIRELGAKVK